MSELKLPVKFDEDLDLFDADGFPLMFGADMIDHNPEMGLEIMRRVNGYDRLAEGYRALRDQCDMNLIDVPESIRQELYAADALLAELDADK